MIIKFSKILFFCSLAVNSTALCSNANSIQWNCKKILLKNKSFSLSKVNAEALENVCSIAETEDLYISELCLDKKMKLNQCAALADIKNHKMDFKTGTNPMTPYCYKIGGIPVSSETASGLKEKTNFNRCIFAKDGSFVSFALMTLLAE